MNIAFLGSSLLSSYWNGAATYYRGIIAALARKGCRTTFYEPDAFDRQKHRDMDPPDWAKVVVYPATPDTVKLVCAGVGRADPFLPPSRRASSVLTKPFHLKVLKLIFPPTEALCCS